MDAQAAIDKARLIIESFDEGGGMTIGFDKPTYELTKEQMLSIAYALYLADCEIAELNENKN
jgi:hypothetical protein